MRLGCGRRLPAKKGQRTTYGVADAGLAKGVLGHVHTGVLLAQVKGAKGGKRGAQANGREKQRDATP